MAKYILIPDSFKGTMSSEEICSIMKEQILVHDRSSEVISIPVADGGEGTVDCFLAAVGGVKKEIEVCGPFSGEKVHAGYALIHDKTTAIVEIASCAGLPMVDGRADPRKTTTYGLGELLLETASSGAGKVVVGLGGSATNDGGCGAAAAIGVRFFNKEGNEFIPTGGTLLDIDKIDASGKSKAFDSLEILAMCDIDNPMYGPTGAAAVFGPQKGADEEMVAFLDEGLRHLSEVIRRDVGIDVSEVPGSGAAGALGAGMIAFFGATLQMGIDVVLDTVLFDDLLDGTFAVFTGEGKIDYQSLRGKVVIGVSRRAKKKDIPVFAFVGDIGDAIEAAYDEGVTGILSINRVAVDFKDAKKRSKEDMKLTVDNFMRMAKRMML